MTLMPEQHKLNAEQREEARRLMGRGKHSARWLRTLGCRVWPSGG
jgi:hypothetical protein